MIKVAKFGGSSLANSQQFIKVKQITDEDITRKFIVASACGKSDDDDHKITDLLYLCYAHVKYGVSYESIFKMIKNKYLKIKEDLALTIDLDQEFSLIESLMHKDTNIDYLVSRGEYLTAKCLAEYLDMEFIDAINVICFEYNGDINYQRSKENLERELAKTNKRVVIPGFYGGLPKGQIKIMTRGGSDITGAIIANIVDADVYENWTDVSGILVTSPKYISNPHPIKRITYDELRELSYMGANVLHDEALFPVRIKNIPINIRNTNRKDDEGTIIMESCAEQDKIDPPHAITGIAGKQNFTAIVVKKAHASSEVGILKRALDVFAEYKVSIESIPSSIDSFSIVVSSEAVASCLYELVSKLKDVIKADAISIVEHLSLVAIVGRGLVGHKGMSGNIFSELGKHDINVKLINQGSDELNIIIGVDNEDFVSTIQCIYQKFIEGGSIS